MTKKYLYGGRPAKVSDASGIEGMLLRTFDGSYFFRVYHEDGEFTDYDLRHDDLSVTITLDSLAAFYELEEVNILDHSPQVLGLQEVEEA